MKTTIKSIAAALCLLAIFCTFAFAQAAEKQKVAVYMAGTEPKWAKGSHKTVGEELVKAINLNDKYSAADHTKTILAQLDNRQGSGAMGAVDDAQIKALGKQLGVRFLCIVEIIDRKPLEGPRGFGGDPEAKNMTVRLVDVETAKAVNTVAAVSNLKDRKEMVQISQKLAEWLLAGWTGANTFTDPRDGRIYRTVKIGRQTWMAENLNYSTGMSWCYENNDSNCEKYGRLYTWDAAMKACPAGWSLPDFRMDWESLFWVTDGPKSLKSISGWSDRKDGSSGNGTDNFGFSALPGGSSYFFSGKFSDAGTTGYWWSAAKGDEEDKVWSPILGFDIDRTGVIKSSAKNSGQSVRCIQK